MSNKNSRSEVWDFFIKIDYNIADCKLCGKHVKTGGGTTNLRNHLRSKHPSYKTTSIIEIQNSEEEEDTKIQSTSSPNSSQASTSLVRKITTGSRKNTEDSNNSTVVIKPEANDKHLNANLIKTRKRRADVVNSPVRETIVNNNCTENEFDYFCKSIAIQLKNMPLDRALICQEKLQRVMTAERIHQCRGSSSPGNSSFAEGLFIVESQMNNA